MISLHSSPLLTYIKVDFLSLKGRPSIYLGPIRLLVARPRFLPQQFGAVCRNNNSQFSMQLCSRLLLRPSASSPLDNKAHTMANTTQAPHLERLHRGIHGMVEQMKVINENNARLIQLLVATNPPPLVMPPFPDIERSHHSHRSGDDHSQNNRKSRSSSKTLEAEGGKVKRGRSPRRNDQTRRWNTSTSQKIRDLDASLDAIITGAGALGSTRSWFRKLPPGTIDSFGDLSRFFVANFMSCRIRQKNALTSSPSPKGNRGLEGLCEAV
ncbi:hypothetical protein Acr_00g0034020 [Actinidia rufa]|uniref:Uncharacterized protein n=1 Tax=Actinidia rufa TaxID=165716 RepID=A0A7J0DGZ4_9ERIC|nr:hypothetical protein Acr_00g0034020 [Actinidia rufa]